MPASSPCSSPPQRLSPLRHLPRPPPPQTTGPCILDARRGEGHQGAGGGHVLHHGPQGPAGRPLDELAGVPHLLEQAGAISSASWSIFSFKARKSSPRVLMGRRDTLEWRLVTLERDGRGTLPGCWALPRAPAHTKKEPAPPSRRLHPHLGPGLARLETETLQLLWAKQSRFKETLLLLLSS